MGIDVEVWDEARLFGQDGANPPVIGEGGEGFDYLFLSAGGRRETFKLLQYVDEYGTTVFMGSRCRPSWRIWPY